jgi:hypothetical protein
VSPLPRGKIARCKRRVRALKTAKVCDDRDMMDVGGWANFDGGGAAPSPLKMGIEATGVSSNLSEHN